MTVENPDIHSIKHTYNNRFPGGSNYMQHQIQATTVYFAHTSYLCVAFLLTVSRTYYTALLLTVHCVWCEERPASTTDFNFRPIFTEQCLSRLVARLALRKPDFHDSSFHVRSVVYKMAMGQVLFPEYVEISLPVLLN